ncbi:hypothetical protein [Streptomyces sp. NPDC102282]|uniref:hypothetical protein n=1 Tax=Streptomyces sp. NPDC102282 TaxID=3366154 RepID=UPI00382C9620
MEALVHHVQDRGQGAQFTAGALRVGGELGGGVDDGGRTGPFVPSPTVVPRVLPGPSPGPSGSCSPPLGRSSAHV